MSDAESAAVAPTPRRPPILPFEARDLWGIFTAPTRAIGLVLAQYDRLVQTLIGGRHVGLVIGVLFYASVLFAAPYGAVLDWERAWRVPVLFLGSLLICLPSLQVFSAYAGCKVDSDQSIALGLVTPCVAAVFTFGFFPIYWFLRETMEMSTVVTAHQVSIGFLAVSLVAGIAHLYRCLARFGRPAQGYMTVVTLWQALFLFISYRMAHWLGLLG